MIQFETRQLFDPEIWQRLHLYRRRCTVGTYLRWRS